MNRNSGIGVFDSGVGGLTVASKISRLLPDENIIYFGDTAHLPYGDKTEEQIISYVFNIIDFLMEQQVKTLVMACNTSSAIVLPKIQGILDIPVIGVIEHASRQAIKHSPRERIGVVANPVTVRSSAYKQTIHTFSRNGVLVYQQACPRWVPLIEQGKVAGEEVEQIVREDLTPLIEAEIDTLILGCTHYPYFTNAIRKILPDGVAIIDPAEAVAESLKEILTTNNLQAESSKANHKFFVSGDPEDFRLKGSWFFGQWIEQVNQVNLDHLVSSLHHTIPNHRPLATAS